MTKQTKGKGKGTKGKGKQPEPQPTTEETPQDANVEDTTTEEQPEETTKPTLTIHKGGRGHKLSDEEKAAREALKAAEKERKAQERAAKKEAKEQAKQQEKAAKKQEKEQAKAAKAQEAEEKKKAKEEAKKKKAEEKANRTPASKVRASWAADGNLTEGSEMALSKTINGRSTVKVGSDIRAGTEVKACWDCHTLYAKHGGMFRPRFSEAFLDALDEKERAEKEGIVQPRCVACDRARSRRKSGYGAIRKFVLQFSTLDPDEVVIHPDRKNYGLATDGEFSTLRITDDEMEPKLRGDIVSMAYERDIKIVFTSGDNPEMTGITNKVAKAVLRSADAIKPLPKPEKVKKEPKPKKEPKAPKAGALKPGDKPKVRDLAAEKAAKAAKKAEKAAAEATINPKLKAMFDAMEDNGQEW